MKRFTEAEPLMRRALAIHETSFGEITRMWQLISAISRCCFIYEPTQEAAPLMRRQSTSSRSFEVARFVHPRWPTFAINTGAWLPNLKIRRPAGP